MYVVYMGDKWNANGPGGVGNASYRWLPFERCPEGTIIYVYIYIYIYLYMYLCIYVYLYMYVYIVYMGDNFI